MGMVMHMAGMSVDSLGGESCLVLLYKGLELDTPLKFWAAVIFSFAMGVSVEAMSAARRRCLRRQYDLHETSVSQDAEDPTFPRTAALLPQRRSSVFSGFYRSGKPNSFVGYMCVYIWEKAASYMLMLLAMSFSLEVFAAVVLGLALGHCLFALRLSGVARPSSRTIPESSSRRPTTTSTEPVVEVPEATRAKSMRKLCEELIEECGCH